MGGAWGTNREEEKFIQNTGGETLEEDSGGVGRIILKMVWKKMNKIAWMGYMKLEAGASGGLIWTRQYKLGYCKVQRIFWLAS